MAPVIIAVDSSSISVAGWKYIGEGIMLRCTSQLTLVRRQFGDRCNNGRHKWLRGSTTSLVTDASRYRTIIETYIDRAYDSSKTYALLRRIGINPIISLEETLEWIVDLLRDIKLVITLKTLGEKKWARWWVMIGKLLKQHSQHSSIYTKNALWLETWKT